MTTCVYRFFFGLLQWSLFSPKLIPTVPPNIDDSTTSSDVIVREGANVTLRCKATGSPEPSIKWRRDDNSKISLAKNLNGKLWECVFLPIKIQLFHC